MEKLVENKELKGRVKIERNSIKTEGGHAWCAFEYYEKKGRFFEKIGLSRGKKIKLIIDISRNTFATVTELKELRKHIHSGYILWQYYKPEKERFSFLKKKKETNKPKIDENYLQIKKRHIITKNSTIDNGQLETRNTEIVVVDFKKHPELRQVYRKVNRKLHPFFGFVKKKETEKEKIKRVLKIVFNTVKHTLKYDQKRLEEIEKKYINEKISLSIFIQLKKGTDRHMALLCGVLLEKLVLERKIIGKVNICNNKIGSKRYFWCEFIKDQKVNPFEPFSPKPEKIRVILDVFNNCFGTIEEIEQKKHKIHGIDVSKYYRVD